MNILYSDCELKSVYALVCTLKDTDYYSIRNGLQQVPCMYWCTVFLWANMMKGWLQGRAKMAEKCHENGVCLFFLFFKR